MKGAKGQAKDRTRRLYFNVLRSQFGLKDERSYFFEDSVANLKVVLSFRSNEETAAIQAAIRSSLSAAVTNRRFVTADLQSCALQPEPCSGRGAEPVRTAAKLPLFGL